jgi:branched-chain amino acid aminotransferase
VAKEELGIETIERDIDRTELYICDEAFLCGSAMEVTHITDIDGYKIGNGEAGAITHQLSDCYHKIVTGQLKQYADWLTPIY